MSNDLISRKALMDEISSLQVTITGLRAGKGVMLKYMEEYRKSVLKCIDEAPTAYDVDTVCKELEIRADDLQKYWTETYNEGSGGAAEAYYRAIEIVRNGGNKND